MARRPPAPEIVVVERRQVVVDEGVGVQHFEGGGQLVGARRQRARHHARRFHGQDGTQALAAGEDAVPHGAVDGRRLLLGGRQQALQGRVGELTAGFEQVGKHEERKYIG